MADVPALAPAKVNLFLHVGPLDADGYHPLASLVAFADVGDRLSVAPADSLSLTVTGPFAGGLTGEGDNLVLRAVRALAAAAGLPESGLAFTLDKRLPIAAGLGGGPSAAGPPLRLAGDARGRPRDGEALAQAPAAVGADGPMCLYARAAWAEGRGDRLTFEPALPPLPAVLINPGVPSPTGAVYRGYDAGPPAAADRPAPPPVWAVPTVIDWLAAQRNDLQSPAVALQPAIATALDAAAGLPEVRLVRMSGSGATVFALFENSDAAGRAARCLSEQHPDWWVQSTLLS